MEKLPKYEGSLSAPEWSLLALTPEVERSLSQAALPACAFCLGCGFQRVKDTGKVQACRCVNRPLGPEERP